MGKLDTILLLAACFCTTTRAFQLQSASARGSAVSSCRIRALHMLPQKDPFGDSLSERDPEVERATITYTNGNISPSVATYTCEGGSAPNDGDASRTCQADGSWNGTAPTNCGFVDPNTGRAVLGLLLTELDGWGPDTINWDDDGSGRISDGGDDMCKARPFFSFSAWQSCTPPN